MEWWTATVAVGALACAAIAWRSNNLSFLALTAFMPLALHTLYHDFDRFWVLMVAAFVVEGVALARYSQMPPAASEGGTARDVTGEMPA